MSNAYSLFTVYCVGGPHALIEANLYNARYPLTLNILLQTPITNNHRHMSWEEGAPAPSHYTELGRANFLVNH